MARAKVDDLYGELGLALGADAEGIRKAYRKLALKYHPDRTKGDESKTKRFIAIKEAYAVLGDDKLRLAHDKKLSDQLVKEARVAERTATMNKERKRMTEQLHERERAAEARAAAFRAAGPLGAKRSRRGNAADLRNIRARNASVAEQFAAKESRQARASTAGPRGGHGPGQGRGSSTLRTNAANGAGASASMQHQADEISARALEQRLQLRQRQVKLRWTRRQATVGLSHSEDSIAAIMRQFGVVTAVNMGDRGKSATVTFERTDAAAAAVEAADSLPNFKVVEGVAHDRWAGGWASAADARSHDSASAASPDMRSSGSQIKSAAMRFFEPQMEPPDTKAMPFDDLEKDTLRKLAGAAVALGAAKAAEASSSSSSSSSMTPNHSMRLN